MTKTKDLQQIADTVTETYKNFKVGSCHDSCLRMSVNNGPYKWHFHPNSDELFIVLEGKLYIHLTDQTVLELNPLDYLKIPRGLIHKTISQNRTVNITYELDSTESIFLEDIQYQKVKEELHVKNLLEIGRSIHEDSKSSVLEEINSDVMQMAVSHGTLDWHTHPNSDELFLGIEGYLEFDFCTADSVILGPYQILTIPQKVQHRTTTTGRSVSISFRSTQAFSL